MNIKKFIEILTEDEYMELEEIIIRSLKNPEHKDYLQFLEDKRIEKDINSKRTNINDFREDHKFEIPARLYWALGWYADEFIYLDKLNRVKILEYRNIGKETIMILDKIMETGNYNTAYYYKGTLRK